MEVVWEAYRLRGKADGKSRGISSLVSLEDIQGKTSEMFFLFDTIVIVDNNQVVIDTI